MKCEYCRQAEIGDYIINKDGSKKSRFYDGVKIMPCCKAEVCAECFKKIKKSTTCDFCGKEYANER